MLGSSLESTKSTHLQNTAADESSSISHPSDRRSLALGMASVKDKEWPFAEIEALTLRLDGSITGAQLAGSRRLCITTDGGKLCTYKLSENMDGSLSRPSIFTASVGSNNKQPITALAVAPYSDKVALVCDGKVVLTALSRTDFSDSEPPLKRLTAICWDHFADCLVMVSKGRANFSHFRRQQGRTRNETALPFEGTRIVCHGGFACITGGQHMVMVSESSGQILLEKEFTEAQGRSRGLITTVLSNGIFCVVDIASRTLHLFSADSSLCSQKLPDETANAISCAAVGPLVFITLRNAALLVMVAPLHFRSSVIRCPLPIQPQHIDACQDRLLLLNGPDIRLASIDVDFCQSLWDSCWVHKVPAAWLQFESKIKVVMSQYEESSASPQESSSSLPRWWRECVGTTGSLYLQKLPKPQSLLSGGSFEFRSGKPVAEYLTSNALDSLKQSSTLPAGLATVSAALADKHWYRAATNAVPRAPNEHATGIKAPSTPSKVEEGDKQQQSDASEFSRVEKMDWWGIRQTTQTRTVSNMMYDMVSSIMHQRVDNAGLEEGGITPSISTTRPFEGESARAPSTSVWNTPEMPMQRPRQSQARMGFSGRGAAVGTSTVGFIRQAGVAYAQESIPAYPFRRFGLCSVSMDFTSISAPPELQLMPLTLSVALFDGVGQRLSPECWISPWTGSKDAGFISWGGSSPKCMFVGVPNLSRVCAVLRIYNHWRGDKKSATKMFKSTSQWSGARGDKARSMRANIAEEVTKLGDRIQPLGWCYVDVDLPNEESSFAHSTKKIQPVFRQQNVSLSDSSIAEALGEHGGEWRKNGKAIQEFSIEIEFNGSIGPFSAKGDEDFNVEHCQVVHCLPYTSRDFPVPVPDTETKHEVNIYPLKVDARNIHGTIHNVSVECFCSEGDITQIPQSQLVYNTHKSFLSNSSPGRTDSGENPSAPASMQGSKLFPIVYHDARPDMSGECRVRLPLQPLKGAIVFRIAHVGCFNTRAKRRKDHAKESTMGWSWLPLADDGIAAGEKQFTLAIFSGDKPPKNWEQLSCRPTAGMPNLTVRIWFSSNIVPLSSCLRGMLWNPTLSTDGAKLPDESADWLKPPATQDSKRVIPPCIPGILQVLARSQPPIESKLSKPKLSHIFVTCCNSLHHVDTGTLIRNLPVWMHVLLKAMATLPASPDRSFIFSCMLLALKKCKSVNSKLTLMIDSILADWITWCAVYSPDESHGANLSSQMACSIALMCELTLCLQSSFCLSSQTVIDASSEMTSRSVPVGTLALQFSPLLLSMICKLSLPPAERASNKHEISADHWASRLCCALGRGVSLLCGQGGATVSKAKRLTRAISFFLIHWGLLTSRSSQAVAAHAFTSSLQAALNSQSVELDAGLAEFLCIFWEPILCHQTILQNFGPGFPEVDNHVFGLQQRSELTPLNSVFHSSVDVLLAGCRPEALHLCAALIHQLEGQASQHFAKQHCGSMDTAEELEKGRAAFISSGTSLLHLLQKHFGGIFSGRASKSQFRMEFLVLTAQLCFRMSERAATNTWESEIEKYMSLSNTRADKLNTVEAAPVFEARSLTGLIMSCCYLVREFKQLAVFVSSASARALLFLLKVLEEQSISGKAALDYQITDDSVSESGIPTVGGNSTGPNVLSAALDDGPKPMHFKVPLMKCLWCLVLAIHKNICSGNDDSTRTPIPEQASPVSASSRSSASPAACVHFTIKSVLNLCPEFLFSPPKGMDGLSSTIRSQLLSQCLHEAVFDPTEEPFAVETFASLCSHNFRLEHSLLAIRVAGAAATHALVPGFNGVQERLVSLESFFHRVVQFVSEPASHETHEKNHLEDNEPVGFQRNEVAGLGKEGVHLVKVLCSQLLQVAKDSFSVSKERSDEVMFDVVATRIYGLSKQHAPSPVIRATWLVDLQHYLCQNGRFSQAGIVGLELVSHVVKIRRMLGDEGSDLPINVTNSCVPLISYSNLPVPSRIDTNTEREIRISEYFSRHFILKFLDEAAANLQRGGLIHTSRAVRDILIRHYTAHHDARALSNLYSLQATAMSDGANINQPYSFFRVQIDRQNKFSVNPESSGQSRNDPSNAGVWNHMENQDFVLLEGPYTRMADVVNAVLATVKAVHKGCNVELWNSVQPKGNSGDSIESSTTTLYVKVQALQPVDDKSVVWNNPAVNMFTCDTPITLSGGVYGPIEDQGLKRSTIRVKECLPGVLRSSAVASVSETELSPVSAAVESFTSKAEEIRRTLSQGTNGIKSLQGTLNGVVRPQVNVGPAATAQVFLSGEGPGSLPRCGSDEERAKLATALSTLISISSDAVSFNLIHCDESSRPLATSMKEGLEILKQSTVTLIQQWNNLCA